MVTGREFGGKQPQPTAGAAGRYAVSPSSELSDCDGRESDVPAEAGKYSSSYSRMV